MKTAPRVPLGRLPASASWRLHSNHSTDQGSLELRDRGQVPGSLRLLPCRHTSMVGRRAGEGNCVYRRSPEIAWCQCGDCGHDDYVTGPQDQREGGYLTGSVLPWLVRRAVSRSGPAAITRTAAARFMR